MATPATGSTAAGTITVVVGNVRVVGVDGVARVAKVGDKIFAQEVIETGANGIIQVQLAGGRFLDLGRDSKLALTSEILAEAGGGVAVAPAAPSPEDAAAAAKAQAAAEAAKIAAGADPTQVTEATAAGGAPAAGGSADGGGGTPVIIDQANSSGEVTSGFPTGPASIAFPEIEPTLLPVVESAPVISVTVAVNVDIGIGIGEPGSGGGVVILPPGTVVPALGVTAIDIPEGSSGGTHPVSFLITLNQVSESDVTITYTIVPVSADRPTDFHDGAITGTVTIPAGSPGFIVTELIVEDLLPEANESFQIVLSDPIGATLLNDTATVTIVDDDVTLAAADVAGDETGALVTLSGALIPNYGPGDTGSIELSADGATWSAGTGTLAANDGSWTIVVNDNNTYTFTQLTAFTHPDTTSADEPLSFTVAARAEDSAGNFAETDFTVTVDDAGPVANDDGQLASVDDNAAGVKIGTVAQLLANDNYDTDGAATSGSLVIATGDKGGTIAIVNGDLMYTSGINVSEDAETETFTYTIKDADGDTETATFTVEVTDGGPTIGAQQPIEVDEEGLEGGNTDTEHVASGDLAGTAITQSGNLAGLDFGQDGPGDIVLGAVSDTGLRTLSGVVVRTEWDPDMHTLTGLSGSVDVVFTLVIDDVSTGHYVFTLLAPVQHALEGADVTEDDRSFSVAITVTDAEGDPAFGSISVNIDDDSPIAILQASGEDSATLDDSDFTSVTLFSNDGQPTLVDASQYGADGFGSRSFALALSEEGVDSGLDHISGANILLFTENGDIVGRAGSSDGTEVFRFSADSGTGEVTVSQSAAIKHDDPNDPQEQSVAEGTVTQQISAGLIELAMSITDADNDPDSDNIEVGSLVNFLDDGPTLTVTAATGEVLTGLALNVDETVGADRANAPEVADGNP
ncbi:MAG: retention module-containing protein, partial [Betaproteobacteria bacterium]|nr:retention module-containing protein [Betaproteobacteria bacterium]